MTQKIWTRHFGRWLCSCVSCGAFSLCHAQIAQSIAQASAPVTAEQQVQAGVAAGTMRVLADGCIISTQRVTLRLTDVEKSHDAALAAVLGKHSGFIRPAFDPPPADTALARRLGLDRTFCIDLPTGSDSVSISRELAALSDAVEWAEPDTYGRMHVHVPPTDPMYPQQWALNNTGQNVNGTVGVLDADVDWEEAQGMLEGWNLTPVVVALIDTGASQSHPDLAGVLVPGRCTICGDPNATDDDANISHGTQTAGILGARVNNAIGIAGVAPNVRIMPVKVATGLLGSHTATANGLIWASDNGARIASMSLGFQTGTATQLQTLQNSVIYARDRGVMMVASCGNSPGSEVAYPAAWSSVIAVGGTNNTDDVFAGGTTGLQMDLSAPGDQVLTTVDIGSNPNGYTLASGTSMSVPIVSGIGAVVLGVNPDLTSAQVRSILEGSARDLGTPGLDAIFGFGCVNAYGAVVKARDSVYCVADVNHNGSVTIEDLFQFIGYFFVGDIRADASRDGTVTVDDVFSYITTWFLSC